MTVLRGLGPLKTVASDLVDLPIGYFAVSEELKVVVLAG